MLVNLLIVNVNESLSQLSLIFIVHLLPLVILYNKDLVWIPNLFRSRHRLEAFRGYRPMPSILGDNARSELASYHNYTDEMD